ncbi:hypothetical protein Q783_04095 [Carnobacterium inhibens subsp. gilichinskyi]|uniref:Uncharacterized protein n=1 Tax=Carnobacterium inhibens subsp. gilichinskyi TaxID=1266845 RepID=U5SFY5_9LACT|nr:hypothetical protein Q783_04095 [Carnobacterium inhibens subsp. gilichinskyi]
MQSNNKHTVTKLEQSIQLYLNEGISFKGLEKNVERYIILSLIIPRE